MGLAEGFHRLHLGLSGGKGEQLPLPMDEVYNELDLAFLLDPLK